MYKNFTEDPNRPYDTVINRKFVPVHTENLYGRACGRVLSDNWTSDKAVDELITRMKQIVGN